MPPELQQQDHSMYKILGQDGKEYGPVNADAVRQWIAEGRVNAQTRIRAEGSADWKAPTDFPEFAATVAAGVPPLPPSTAGPGIAGQNKGLAITSLILGILSLTCGGIFLGIPAIICGHIACNRARRSPAEFGGKGMAIAGFVMGYCGIIFTSLILLGLLLPPLARAKTKAQSFNCVNNLKQIGLAARMYAMDNKDVFPPDFIAMSNELNSPKILYCPADKSHTRATNWARFSASANVSYEFLTPGAKDVEGTRKPAFRCTVHKHVCYGDGAVDRGDARRSR